MLFRIGFIIVVVLAIAAGLLLGSLNADPVEVDLLWIQLNWPLGLMILTSAAAGLLLGLFLAWFFAILPLRMKSRRAGKE